MELFAIIENQVTKESKIVAIVRKANESVTAITPRRTHNQFIKKKNSQPQYFYWYRFLRKNKIIDYFY